MKSLKLILALALGLSLLAGLFPLTTGATGLLTNGGFNNPFNDISTRIWHEQPEKIADGWTYFYIDANTYPGSGNASKLHWMSSAQFAANFGGGDYHQEGDQAQVMWSSYQFDAGVYQQVSNLTPGQVYQFDIDMVTYWRGPGYPDTNDKMVKQVGIDPYGGTDPASPDIIWGPTDADDKAWVGMLAAATAESSTITVFAKVQAPENDSYNHTDLDMVYFEDARLQDISSGATTTLNSDVSGATINLTWTGSAAESWSFKGYEVRYKDLAGGEWVTLQDKSGVNTSGSFTGQAAHTYLIQARTWQTIIGLDIPGRWSEISVTVKNAVVGQVINYTGLGLNDVTVLVSGMPTSTLSANGGYYTLATGSGTFAVAASDTGDLVAPPAATVMVPADGIGVLTITLRPGGDSQVMVNNDLETDLTGWNASDLSAAGISTTQHTGSGSLWLLNTVSVSQTSVVSGMARPLLSFWYKNDAPFTVELLIEDTGGETVGLGVAQSRLLEPVSDWTYFTLGSSGVYTGSVGVNFSYPGDAGANILIDEVSLAAGPELIPTYLPVVIKDN